MEHLSRRFIVYHGAGAFKKCSPDFLVSHSEQCENPNRRIDTLRIIEAMAEADRDMSVAELSRRIAVKRLTVWRIVRPVRGWILAAD